MFSFQLELERETGQKMDKPECGIERLQPLVSDALAKVRRWISPSAGLKVLATAAAAKTTCCQKMDKPECGIESEGFPKLDWQQVASEDG